MARELQQAQKANGLVNNVQVVNMPGAGGTIALGNVSVLSGQANNLLVGGTGLLAATVQFDSAATLDDVTPLAVMVEEREHSAVVTHSVATALDVALGRAKPGDLILVTGSIIVVGELLNQWDTLQSKITAHG